MYIIAIGWLYVVLMMALTEKTLIAGVMTFFGYGVIPLALFLWVFAPRRPRRGKLTGVSEDVADQPDGPHAKGDE